MRRFFSVLFLVCFVFAPAAFAQEGLETSAKQGILIDYDTGTVLYEKNADEKMPTSSMSKTMTLYMVFDALKNGQISLDTEFLVSEKAWRMGGSKMFVEVDKRVPVEELIRGVSIQSGNDATIVLAEGLAGTEDAFAAAMTERAQQLGMTNTNFVNASGWPDDNHYSTARDLAIMTRALIREFPDYYPYFAEKEFVYHNITQRNRNPLLYRNIGADGVKTGHTEAAGYGLIGSGVAGERRVIFVLNGMADERERAQEGSKILEWGLRAFTNKALFAANASVGEAQVVMGQKGSVPLVVKDDVTVTLPKMAVNSVKAFIEYEAPLVAPVQGDEAVGRLVVKIPQAEPMEYPLYAGESVPELGFFAKTFAKARMMMSGS